MGALGIERFCLCGHDRGARVAHRLALNYAARVKKLCVLDIAPALDMFGGRCIIEPCMVFGRAWYRWFHLLQSSPLPEIMIGANRPETACSCLHAELGRQGSAGLKRIGPEALAECERCFCNAEALHTAYDDFRGSSGVDLDHDLDRESRLQGSKVACDLQVLRGELGVVNQLFNSMALWRAQCSGRLAGRAIDSGHFISEKQPEATPRALLDFFR